MTIISANFYLFLFLLTALYYVFPIKIRWFTLLCGSIYFYLQISSPYLFILMLMMSFTAYSTGLMIQALDESVSTETAVEQLTGIQKRKNISLGTGIFLEIGILVSMQNHIFFIDNINRIAKFASIDISLEMLSWIAPLGISYYTLMMISYMLDVSWGMHKSEDNPLKFLLFTCYFPQMISGPISRYREVEETLLHGNRFQHTNITFGCQRILWGLFKKLVIAERLSTLVVTIYSDYHTYHGIYVAIAIVCYALLLYFDFSGYVDIVLGVSQLFGVILPENFNTPFVSTNLSEIWRRWHMTLGFWVKDYLLYPFLKSSFAQKIGKWSKQKFNKKLAKKIPVYCGMFCTWFYVGFWHGGSWKYIFGSGLFFFIMIVGGQLLEPVEKKILHSFQIKTDCFSYTLFCRIRTFILFSSSISFGRANSLLDGFGMWKQLLLPSNFNPWILFDGSLYKLGLDRQDFWVMIYAIGVVCIVSNLQQRMKIRESIAEQNLVFRWILWLLLIFSIIIYGFYGPGYDPADFIYGGF